MDLESNRIHKGLSVGLALALLAPVAGWAGESKELQALLESAESIIAVSGTSTLHDWTVTTQTVKGRFSPGALLKNASSWKTLEEPADGLIPISLEVTIPVDTIVSGKSGMDKVMYKSLDMSNQPTITYIMREARRSTSPDAESGDGVIVLETTGDLKVAGAVYPLVTGMKLERLQDDRYRLSGQTPLRMTDFKMKPPKALLGAVRAGDAVEVLFRWTVPVPQK